MNKLVASKALFEARLYDVIRSVVVTEKSHHLSSLGHYVFYVSKDANKTLIKRAVEHVFSVKVVKVRTINVRGKQKIFRNRVKGKRSDTKKAIIVLAEGDSIDVSFGA